MRRNSFDRVVPDVLRKARLDANRGQGPLAPTDDGRRGVNVGANDPETGVWVGYGLLDITPLGADGDPDGFRLSDEE